MENPQTSLNPTQVSTPETTTPEAVSVAPVPKRKTPKILIGVLVLLFLVAGGVFAYDYFKPKMREDENFPTPVPQASVEPVDEMSGWRTISQSDWNFKVPADWKYLQCTSSVEVIFVGPQDEGWLQSDQTSACEFDSQPGTFSLSKLAEPLGSAIPLENSEYLKVDQRRSIMVDGIEATEQIETGLAGQGEGFVKKAVYIQKNGQWYVVWWRDIGSEALFNQILSTLEFMDSQQSSIEDKQIIINLAKGILQQKYPDKQVGIGETELKVDQGWAHGTAGLVNLQASEGGGDIQLFIARLEDQQWRIILETDPEYKSFFQQLPDTVISKEVKDFYKTQ